MAWLSQFMIYLLVWFVVLFAVLPWGVRQQTRPEAGHDPGAPVNPNLGLKAVATTLVSALIWFAYYYVTEVLGYSLLTLSRAAQ
jgi:predicted secreted protein